MDYTVIFDSTGLNAITIFRASDGAYIPIQPLNADYRAFLDWNSQQETPLSLTQSPLIIAQATAQQQLDAWLSTQYATPLVINGVSLAADVASQTRMSALYAAESGGVTYGGVQLTDTTGLVDSNGVWQAMTVQDLFTLLLSYAAACKSVVQTYATTSSAISAATTVDAVNAISLPS